MSNPIIFVDLETTSADALTAEILEVGLHAVNPDTFAPLGNDFQRQYVATRPELVDPGASAIHGLDPFDHGAFGPDLIGPDVLAYLSQWDGVLELGGHNIGVFDQPLLRRYIRHSDYQKKVHYRVRDTAIVAKWMMDSHLIPKLDKFGDIAKHFRVPLTNYHRALPDAKDEAVVYGAMVQQGRRMVFRA